MIIFKKFKVLFTSALLLLSLSSSALVSGQIVTISLGLASVKGLLVGGATLAGSSYATIKIMDDWSPETVVGKVTKYTLLVLGMIIMDEDGTFSGVELPTLDEMGPGLYNSLTAKEKSAYKRNREKMSEAIYELLKSGNNSSTKDEMFHKGKEMSKAIEVVFGEDSSKALNKTLSWMIKNNS